MDGSEPGETLPAAVLSGAPTDLQARTVRYVGNLDVTPAKNTTIANSDFLQYLPPDKARLAVRYLALTPLAYGLGYPAEGSPVGEPAHGMAVFCRWNAGHPPQVQYQGGCDRFRQQAGL